VTPNEIRERLLHPEPGSAIARARDFGIDLTQLARNVTLTPAQRLEKAARARRMAHTLREARQRHGR
jgi:hypothetical protein